MNKNIRKVWNRFFYFSLALACIYSPSGKQSLTVNYDSSLCFPKIEISEKSEPSTFLKSNPSQSEIINARALLAGLPSSGKWSHDSIQGNNSFYFPNSSNKLTFLFDQFLYFTFLFYSNLSSRAPPIYLT